MYYWVLNKYSVNSWLCTLKRGQKAEKAVSTRSPKDGTARPEESGSAFLDKPKPVVTTRAHSSPGMGIVLHQSKRKNIPLLEWCHHPDCTLTKLWAWNNPTFVPTCCLLLVGMRLDSRTLCLHRLVKWVVAQIWPEGYLVPVSCNTVSYYYVDGRKRYFTEQTQVFCLILLNLVLTCPCVILVCL